MRKTTTYQKLAALSVAAILAGSALCSCGQTGVGQPSENVKAVPSTANVVEDNSDVSVTTTDLPEKTSEYTKDDILALTGIKAFNLDGKDAPEIGKEKSAALENAIREIEDRGGCTFLIIDLKDGDGISYNVDRDVYAASCAKMLLIKYVIETMPELDEYTQGLIEACILYSDNDAYDALALNHYTQEFIDWLSQYGIAHQLDSVNGAYPTLNAKNMAAFWIDVNRYLEEGSASGDETAIWLSSLLEQTETSFLRQGLAGQVVATVRDKAGWIAESTDWGWFFAGALDAVNDCGIVETEHGKYIVATLNEIPDNEENELLVENLSACMVEAIEG